MRRQGDFDGKRRESRADLPGAVGRICHRLPSDSSSVRWWTRRLATDACGNDRTLRSTLYQLHLWLSGEIGNGFPLLSGERGVVPPSQDGAAELLSAYHGRVELTGVGVASVRIRRSWSGGWRGWATSRVASREYPKSAYLLSPWRTLMVDEGDQGQCRRLRKLSQLRGEPLLHAPIKREGGLAFVVPASEVVSGRGRGRGVPSGVALARIAQLLDPQGSVGILWGWRGLRLCCVVQQGRLVLPSREPERWYLIGHVSAADLASLPAGANSCDAQGLLPRIGPLGLLALGVALARSDAGTFPCRQKRMGLRVARECVTVLVLLLGLVFWSVEAARVREYRERVLEARQQLERVRWLQIPEGAGGGEG